MAMTVNNVPLKKCNVNGIKCKRINVNGVKVWSSSVVITNVFGKTNTQLTAASLTTTQPRDEHVSGTAVTVTAGHRYYVRATVVVPSIAGTNQYHGTRAVIDGNTICDVQYSPTVGYTETTKTGHIIFTASASSIKPEIQWYISANTTAATHTATFLTLIDITDLETETGTTYTADSFWTDVLESKLFGTTKEIELN